MKIKDLERTANIAWSPANVTPIYLAAGTAGQQLDASFETNASLEIFSLNLTDPSSDLELKSTVVAEHRFNKIVWGSHGSELGTVATASDGGVLQIFNASKLIKGESALMSKQEKHTGAVHSIDFNPFQSNLLASGAASSEIFIWDMNNPGAPMTPGPKLQPYEDVLGVQWNRQVQHILATTFATKCVVWDLRKNETIIKLTDTVSRIRWKVVAWHPEVATQLCLASEEDQAPIIQLWDLRFATSPLKTLENHQRGVLSMAWCSQDPDLLVSTAKDNRIVCWNPNSNQPSGEVLSEVARTNQWNFDVCWCPKNPAIIATPSFDGHVSIYSLMGGKAQQIQTTNKIADSFPGMDGYVQAPIAQNATPVSVDLSKAPKWLKKPVGASFGFGGKLITFENDKESVLQQQQNGQTYISRPVFVSQVITEEELVRKSTELEQALELGNFTDYCLQKADAAVDQHTKYIWHFLKANFETNPRAELLNLLGYKIEDVNARLGEHVQLSQHIADPVGTLSQELSNNRIDSDDVFGDIQKEQSKTPYKISTGNDPEGLIAQALLLNNVEAAVELCLKAKRFADAIIISMTGGPELLARTQTKYLQQCEGYVSSLISALVFQDWASVASNCDIGSWKEALAAAITHSSDEDLPVLCEILGNRLEDESKRTGNQKLLHEAQLCYICAGSFDNLVSSWTDKPLSSGTDLQDLVELTTFLQKSVERQAKNVNVGGRLAELLTSYAGILASQGHLKTALTYLGTSTDPTVSELRDRLYVALGHKPAHAQVQSRSRQSTGRGSFGGFASLPPPVVNPPVNKPFAPNQWQTNATAQPVMEHFDPQPQQPWQTGLPPQTQPWQPAPAMVQPPPPPSSQPSRPSSNGPAGLPKSKYIVDPSVQSGYGRPAMPPYQAAPMGAMGSMGSAFNQPQPQLQQQQQQQIMNQPPVAPMNCFGPPMVPQPIQTQPEFNAPPMVPAAPGWNDPPVLTKSAKTPIPKGEPVQQSPITHPIFGSANPPQQQPPPNANGYLDNRPPQQPFNPYMNNNQMQTGQAVGPPPMGGGERFVPQQQQQQMQMPFNNFQATALNQGVNVARGRNTPTPTKVVEPPPPKLPIPEEHIHMQTVFDALRTQCSRSANNPQTKRKIDDVAKKLETLYDLLREHKLSPNTLATLHQLVQAIQHGDYTGGLALHTQLVSGPDFAQIAAFMPGIKVLLQCALQLQVYLR